LQEKAVDDGFFCLAKCDLTGWYKHIYTNGMKTAISIPDLLFDAAEKVASRLGISRSELYRRALKKYLEDHSSQVVRERLDEVYKDEVDDGRLDPAIEFLQRESLPEDEW
jgi:hypothetical protein